MASEKTALDNLESHPFSLGDIKIYPDTLEVISPGTSTRLEPKIMKLLVYFSSRPGEVISKEQILKDVWGGTIVVDEALHRAISTLRKALGDKKQNPRFLETISTKGYRLITAPAPLGKKAIKAAKTSGINFPASPLNFAIKAAIVVIVIWVLLKVMEEEPLAPPVADAEDGQAQEGPPPKPDE